jgi:hypothetical protein
MVNIQNELCGAIVAVARMYQYGHLILSLVIHCHAAATMHSGQPVLISKGGSQMANWRRKKERREEIRKLNAEGAKAYKDGKHIQNMPAKYNGNMDFVHWRNGYYNAQMIDIAEDNFMDKIYNECTDSNS